MCLRNLRGRDIKGLSRDIEVEIWGYFRKWLLNLLCTNSQELVINVPSHLHIQWCHISSLRSDHSVVTRCMYTTELAKCSRLMVSPL